MRCCTAMPPPSAAMRSIDRSEMVSAWSKNQCRPVERDVLVDLLEHIERTGDRLVIGRMQPPRPAVLRQDADDRLRARPPCPAACRGGQRGSPRSRRPRRRASRRRRCGGSSRRPACTSRLRPVQEVGLLPLRLLREQVVGEPDGELPFVGQLLDDRVVLGIVLEAAAGIDRAGDAEPVELAHEVPGRVDLVVERQLRPLGQGRVENLGVGLGEQQSRRIARRIALDLAAGRRRAYPWCSRPRAALRR